MSLDDRLIRSSSSFRRGGGGGGKPSASPPLLFQSSSSSIRSSGSSRFQSQRQRSAQARKPPEPLRRAVADCLSSSHHFTQSPVASEAARTLRDYLATESTREMAYTVLLEHALSERERSPAVIAKCVGLLKRYLFRYIPREQILQQIDLFCVTSIAECDTVTSRKVSPWLNPTSLQVGMSLAPGAAASPPITSAVFASASLVKSLNYIRALLARHMPRPSFQPAAFAGTSNISKQSSPTLSSLLSSSFSSQLSPSAAVSREPPETKEAIGSSTVNLFSLEKIDESSVDYIATDVLKWRWLGDRCQQHSVTPFGASGSDGVLSSPVIHTHNFREVGAAALLVDLERKQKVRSRNDFDTQFISDPDFEQLLQPSTVTAASNIASAHSHLKAITASKRAKPGSRQVWEEAPPSTFRLRSRPLFQYRHYSEQQPLRLSPAEIDEVIAAVCSEVSVTNTNSTLAPYRQTSGSGRPITDVAVSVLIKLVIDMYVMDPSSAAPLVLSMIEEMLSALRVATRVRAFDLILNLGVHSQLLEPIFSEDSPIVEEEESSHEQGFSGGVQFGTVAKRGSKLPTQSGTSSAVDCFESWLLDILYEVLLLLVQKEEKEETVWAAGLSCLLYFVCDSGRIQRKRLKGIDARVIKSLLETSRQHSWAEVLHSKLICMLINLLYQVPDGSNNAVSEVPFLSIEQVESLGGIEFVCMEYSRANSVEEKRNLFAVFFDYILHKQSEITLSAGGSFYSNDEIQPLAMMLHLVDAPEAFYMAIKHGVDGIGGLLRRSIASAISSYHVFGHLNAALLENVTSEFDSTISMVTHLDGEFFDMMQTTKVFKSFESIQDNAADSDFNLGKVRLAWATLHSLLHSKRTAYRQNGYIWLIELLVSDIISESETSSISNIRKLQEELEMIVVQDASSPHVVRLTTWFLCGLLKSKYNYIRWGFLFVLEKFLMQCQILLNKSNLQHVNGDGVVNHDISSESLEKANAVIGVMNSALLLVVSINETDRINVLKMCDLLFSQLCLRSSFDSKASAGHSPFGDVIGASNFFFGPAGNGCETDTVLPLQQNMLNGIELIGDKENKHCSCVSDSESASMAAMLLSGHASVPMQLVARISTDLFYWPLIQLASAATDDIALGVSVGSKGRGILPGSASDIRAALLLLLIGKCTSDPAVFQDIGGDEFFRRLLDDTDARVAYYASAFLLKRMMTEEPEKYQRVLHDLVFKAQQSNNEKLLENPYLQMRGILQLLNDAGAQL
ncbi:uncharacterized protein LOC116254156 isoform X1 [Nymphaea colorata]|nr:uncharacterized protein LOC116254156 isoform X1 [Nymphaea colorata]